MLAHRLAIEADLDLLAEWNHQLIRDEGHRNTMTVPALRQRMKGLIEGEHRAVIFLEGEEPVAYALYRETPDETALRQFFVRRERRRSGVGRRAIDLLRHEVWRRDKRLVVEVLCLNVVAIEFWRAVGYRDYCLTLEILPL